ncbi:MAG: hypothetical protein M3Y57_20380 [Acidobacteriota bacterium]|nr:hypothetical protein [Acidobacteriota bacterium]
MSSTETQGSEPFGERQRLPREISTIQIIAAGEEKARMGLIVSIPAVSEVELCGIGFNDRTVRICWQGGYYFVFLDDLAAEPEEQNKAQAAGSSE